MTTQLPRPQPRGVREYDLGPVPKRPASVLHSWGADRPPASVIPPRPRSLAPAVFAVLFLGGALFYFSMERRFLLGEVSASVVTPLLLYGLLRGGIRKVITLAALFGAIYLGATLPAMLTPLLAGVAGSSAGLLSFLVTGVVSIIGMYAAGRVAKSLRTRIIKRPLAVSLDRLVGSLIGAAEGVLVVLSLCWVCTMVEPHTLKLRDQGGLTTDSIRFQMADYMVRLSRDASIEPIGGFVQATNIIRHTPALRDAIESLNRTGQMQFDGLDPQLLEQIRKLLPMDDVAPHLAK